MTWQEDLYGVLGSYFSDSSIEEGAAELVFVSEDNLDYHRLYLSAFEEGTRVAGGGSPEEKAELLAILRRSNLAVATAEEARNLLGDVQVEYLKQYHLALTRLAANGDTH